MKKKEKRMKKTNVLWCFIAVVLILFQSCAPAGEGGTSSQLYGTWKSNNEVMISNYPSDYFEGYVYAAFSDDKVIFYMDALGSSDSLDYTYDSTSHALTIVDSTGSHMVSAFNLNGVLTLTGLQELDFFTGLVGAPQMNKISDTIDIEPNLPPSSEEEKDTVSGKKWIIKENDNSLLFEFDNGNVTITENWNSDMQTINAQYEINDGIISISSDENAFTSLFGSSSFTASQDGDNLILSGITWTDGRDYDNTAVPDDGSGEDPDKPVTGDSYFFGTWETVNDVTWRPVDDPSNVIMGKVRASFTDETVVVWMSATGSSAAMPYTYEKQAEGTYLLNIEGEISILAMDLNGHLSMTGLLNVKFFDGNITGDGMFDRISSTPDVDPNLPPGGESGDGGDEEGGSDFTIDGSTITEYHGDDTEIIIPSSVNGVTITRIDERAFSGNKEIISVEIPSTVVSIGSMAFYECSNLREVTLEPSSEYRSIGGGAFSRTAIEEITIPSKTLVSGTYSSTNGVFEECEKLVSVTIADGITLGHNCFNGCTSLKEVNLPETLEEIQYGAFEGCVALESIILPDGLETIEETAFKNTGLKSINIPASVTDIRGNAFNDTSAVVTVSPSNRVYAVDENNHIVRKASRTTLAAYVGDVMAEMVIPSGYTEILNIFESSEEIESITIPATLEVIGSSAFRFCENLSEVKFEEGSNLKEIKGIAFYNCGSMKSIYLPEGLESIGYDAFRGVYLKEIGYPKSMKKLENSFISNGQRLTVNFYGTQAEWDAMPDEAKPQIYYWMDLVCLGDSI